MLSLNLAVPPIALTHEALTEVLKKKKRLQFWGLGIIDIVQNKIEPLGWIVILFLESGKKG